MLSAALLLLLAATGVSDWVDALASRDPALRQEAQRELLRRGNEAAEALEKRAFSDPEARRLADRILGVLRRPRLSLEPPLHVGVTERQILLHILVHNPAPRPFELRGFWTVSHRRVHRDPVWLLRLPKGLGAPRAPRHRDVADGTLTVPAGGKEVIVLGLPLSVKRPTDLAVHLTYETHGLVMHASATVVVGHSTLTVLRQGAYAASASRRARALRLLRHRLTAGGAPEDFDAAVRAMARSSYVDVRYGIARALAESGQHRHIGLLTALAADRQRNVATEAMRALAAKCDLRSAPRELHRLAARYLISTVAWRPDAIETMLGRVSVRSRRVFLAMVLQSSRNRGVHASVVRLLGRDGVVLAPHAVTGLVSAAEIERVRTA